MREDIFFEIHQDLPREGPGKDKYTRKAFNMLPRLEKPAILDIGCGPGAQTMELARLSGGRVTGIDTHQPYLDKLQSKIDEAGLRDRVRAEKKSMFTMKFPEESFDIIWAEGSIYIIGFERGMREWKRFIKPRGYLAANELAWLRPDPPEEIAAYWKRHYPAIAATGEKIASVSGCGYDLLGHFPLPEDAWWTGYYGPLAARIRMLGKKYAANDKAMEVLDNEQKEIEMYKKYSRWYGSVFFVMQKR